MRAGPKPVVLPANAVSELELVAASLDAQAKQWPASHSNPYMKRWLAGMRRGFTDAAMTCRRRASRIRKALRERRARRDAAALRSLRAQARRK